MKKKIFVILVVLGIFFSYHLLFSKETRIEANVVRVIDGDTFVTDSGERIRLIGMNTPEKNEYYYKEAKNRLEELVGNKTIFLENDAGKKDKYGRSLRYVFTNDTFVNIKLVEEGYARPLTIKPNYKYETEIEKAASSARNRDIGIWNSSGKSL